MADRTLHYYFTPVSPYAYLGHARLLEIARESGVRIAPKPVDYGRIFAASGGLPLAKRAPQRQAYRQVELRRWSDFLHIPLNVQPAFFPCAADVPSRWILAASEENPARAVDLCGATGRALWAEERNPADAATLAALATDCGLDARALAERAASPELVSYYDLLTQQAIDAGVFGAPTYIVDGELFWGQDRLDFLARKLAK
ncbi:MAG TPA: 2-hydroxychromene-2-carboxylate isomerase [Casimicrobiaceae bacterium]